MTEKYTFELTKKELPIFKEIMLLGQFSLFHSNNLTSSPLKVLVKILKKTNEHLGIKYGAKILADENEVIPLYEKYFMPAIENLFKQTCKIEFKPTYEKTKEGKL